MWLFEGDKRLDRSDYIREVYDLNVKESSEFKNVINVNLNRDTSTLTYTMYWKYLCDSD